MNREIIRGLIQKYQPYTVQMRREFHEYPEISGHEVHTRQVLIREIEAMGLPYEKVEGTGLIAMIHGEKSGPYKVLRSDIDGLAVTEEMENLRGKKVCVSQKQGFCHACGHDAHMAMLLGTMRVLCDLKDQLEGTVCCCFEEGEEDHRGVDAMLESLAQYPIEQCFALHVYSGLEAGKMNIVPGARMAGTVGIGFYVNGRAGHGSRPDQSINPIIPAAHMITQLDSAFRNQIDAEKTVTLGLCQFQAGEAFNVFPERAYIGGSARFFDRTEGEKALAIIRNVAEHTAACHKCTVTFTEKDKVLLWPVVNDETVARQVCKAVSEIADESVLSPCDRWFASESFGKYLEKYPGALGFLGIRNEAYGSGAPHHNGKFDVDEDVLSLGMMAEVGFVLESNLKEIE